MGALIKLLFLVAVSVVVLQTTDGESIIEKAKHAVANAKDSIHGLTHRHHKSSPDHEMKSIDKSEKFVRNRIDRYMGLKVDDEKKALKKIKHSHHITGPKKHWMLYAGFLETNIDVTRFEVRLGVCEQHKHFKKFIEHTHSADPELEKYMKSDEFKQKMKIDTPKLDPAIVAALKKNPKKEPQLNADLHGAPASDSLSEQKRYFTKRTHELTHMHDNKFESFEKAAEGVYNALRNGVISWSDLKRDMKGGRKYPESIAAKAIEVQIALGAGQDLGCWDSDPLEP